MSKAEIWKDIEGFENRYEISSFGNVRNKKTEKYIKPTCDPHGYYFVTLRKVGETKTNSNKIHRLVAIAFIPNERNKIQVNHKDGIKTNNNVSNLEWTSQSENMRHALDNFDNKHLKRVMILETKEIFKSLAECARQKGLNQKCISECINGRNKTHKKYHFIKVK